MAAKAIHQAIKSKEKTLIDARIEEKKRKKQEREDRKKRKETNQLKSAVFQVAHFRIRCSFAHHQRAFCHLSFSPLVFPLFATLLPRAHPLPRVLPPHSPQLSTTSTQPIHSCQS